MAGTAKPRELLKARRDAGKAGALGRLLSTSATKVLLHKIEFQPASHGFSSQPELLRAKYLLLNPRTEPAEHPRGAEEGQPGKQGSDRTPGRLGDGVPAPQKGLFPAGRLAMQWQRVQRIGAGLLNLGNTCFLNATLQCLTYTPPLANYLLSREHSRTCHQSGFCMMCVMQNHVTQAFANSGSVIKPVSFVRDLKKIAPHIRLGRQEDAHEFLRFTIDAMQKACLPDCTELDRQTQATTLIHQIFGGSLRSRVKCSMCKAVSDTFDPCLDLPVEITVPGQGQQAANVEQALELFVKPDLLGGENAYLCDKCKKKVSATKRFTIHRAPRVLTLALKRFADFTGGKITKDVGYPELLNIRPYMSQTSGDPVMYGLYAVLVHSGYSSHAGHYYCYVKASDGQWYQMNDNVVRPSNIKVVLNQQAYVLFYLRGQNLHLYEEFGENRQPAQMTDILMVAIEALTAEDICDRQMGSRVLDTAMGDPASWMTDVPKLMRYIYKNIEGVSTEPARHSLHSLLLLLTERCSREVVRSLLEISPTCDSAALAMWEVMISMPGTLWSVLTELRSVLQDLQLHKVFSCAMEDACISLLALLLRTDFGSEKFAVLYKPESFLRNPSWMMLSVVLESLITLSKAHMMARKILVLLPDIMETMQDTNSDVKRKALLLFRNTMGHLDREEASPIALQLAEKLLPLFDDESSLVREFSISLFRDVMDTVVGRNKKMLRKTVKRVLVPLFLRMNDQSKSVAKASRDALLDCAGFLGWRNLSTLVQTHQIHRIGECLLQQDKSRLEEQLCQSLLYVKDAQATVRLEAVRFTGLGARYLKNRSNKVEKLNEITKGSDRTPGRLGDGVPAPQKGLFPAGRLAMQWQRVQRIGAGLLNLGNTCFLNATLQCLTYTPPLANYLLSREHSRTCHQSGFCMMCVMQNHVTQAFANSGSVIKPVSLVRDLKKIAPHIRLGRQEDAHEFLRFTIDAMQKACLPDCTELDRQTQATTLIHQIFGGSLRSRVKCSMCKAVSDTFDPCLDLPVEITVPGQGQQAANVEQALELFVKPDLLGGENAYLCDKCKKKVSATKRFTIHRAPRVLTLALKRFADFTGGKITKDVVYPELLNIRPYMSQTSGDPVMYGLYAVLVHSGYSSHAGHYYCYVKASDGQWYQMNDNVVRPSNIKVVLNQQAYVLFYLRGQNLHLYEEFGENRQPAQMTDILMVAIEALTAEDICDRQMGSRVLDTAMGDPASWMTDVPKLMRYIYKNIEGVSTEPARHSLHSLLLLLTERCSREVVRSLLEISPTCDSAALAMWEVMISMPGTLWSVLTELRSVLQDLQLHKVFSCAMEDACISLLALLLRTDFGSEKFAVLYKPESFLRNPSWMMLSVVLESLITLSKAHMMARKILVLLPDIMETMQDTNSDVKRKALLLFRNTMGHLDREEASPIALQLAEKLLPLFDDESSLVREFSISLFRDVMDTVVGRNKKMLRKTVKRVLVPLFLRMNDQSKSVAKASRDALLDCAGFLGWRNLSTLVQTHQIHRIGECLLQQDKSRLEEQLCQSLLYVKDAQATVRLEAVRFTGLGARYLKNRSNKVEKLNEITKGSDRTPGRLGDGVPAPQKGLFPAGRLAMQWQRVQRIGAGLLNLGNTCFLNATLQCLTYTPPLANYLLSREHSRTCHQSGFCMTCVMQNHVTQAFANSGSVIKPVSLVRDLKKIAPHIRLGRQEDAHEFLRFTIDAMQKACLPDCTELDRQTQATTLIHQIFGGSLRSRVKCSMCKAVSDTFDPCLDLPVEITVPGQGQQAANVEQALELFVKPDLLGGENAYLCDKCKKKVSATKRFTIHRAPRVLTLALKRFADFTGGKITKDVGYPELLNIRPYMSQTSGDPVMYGLYAVLVHSGYSSHAGHYYCYVKASDGQWYQMNDNVVRPSNIKVVLNQQAYVLFYLREDSSRVEDYLRQSLPYLQSPQEPLREADVMFLGQNSRAVSLLPALRVVRQQKQGTDYFLHDSPK
ncbi:hypothetical protein Q9966_008408 [Columba livia]|nr:hypothetical protein Q9966_008408 [Columba livia]